MIDVQTTQPPHSIAINQVGIKNLRHPVLITLENTVQNTVADFTITVHLDAHKRGTHMSRFVEILNDKQWQLSIPALKELLVITSDKLQAKNVNILANFEIFINKKAPVSNLPSLVNYQASINSDLQENSSTISITVPVTTLCPCSKKISDYGAHNQRSHVIITAGINHNISVNEIVSFEYLIKLAEKSASCEIYSLLKRCDEKYVTEYAYNNPKFVEDVVREVAKKLSDNPSLSYYKVEVENFESIHNHSAYAVIDSRLNIGG